MTENIENKYINLVENNLISHDLKQVQYLKKIAEIWKNSKKINFLSKIKKYNGIYVFGPPGIGKTFIINLFLQNIKKGKKYHFNHLMINIHAFINSNKNKNKEPLLETYIRKIAKNNNVIFIDELHIYNIVDALLIKKIFLFFIRYKVFILISSNFSPDELYMNGLQRDDFIPFIQYINNKFKVLSMLEIKDYRRVMLNQSKTYFSPINKDSINEFNKLFYRFVDEGQIYIRKIPSKSRVIRFEKCTSNIAYCKFEDLCDSNLSHGDYINISKAFNLIFLFAVPQFSASTSDQCRRFIGLIDILYDNQCSVVILADKPIKDLCRINNLSKEFKRTESRLYEMTIINPNKK